MNKNIALAFIISFGILLGWETLVMRPQRKAAKKAQVRQLESPPKPAEPAPKTQQAAPANENLIEHKIGFHQITFNLYGASVRQWSIQDKDGSWIPLVQHAASESQDVLATFPSVPFQFAGRTQGTVRFSARHPDGLFIEKTFQIDPRGYRHDLTLVMRNQNSAAVQTSYSLGWSPGIGPHDSNSKSSGSDQRIVALEPPKLHKLKEGSHEGTYKWWAVDSPYFMALFENNGGQIVHIKVDKIDKSYVAKKTTSIALPVAGYASESVRFYLGPKGYDHLASFNQEFERTVDFGVFGELGKIVLKVLYFFHGLTQNYGWSIILLTLVIQIITLPLTIKSFRHSLRMKTLQPQMKKLQAAYKGDPKRLNAEMLNLYQKHGLRFMGMEGCFPVLIQLPVFWALYTTLRNTYELRGAPWIGWVTDLSVHDPYYVLPILMGAGMLLQQRNSMSSVDPAQARMMYLMPVMFTFFFLKLPAGLVLYWFTNSLLSIIVQAFLARKNTLKKVAA